VTSIGSSRYRSRQVGRLLEVTRMVGYLTPDLVIERD